MAEHRLVDRKSFPDPMSERLLKAPFNRPDELI
jgi:hypothetical protein